ncbi:MAG: hypothetical protein RIS64_1663 [Bacteroidota bacterium]|jgi:DNA-directed RNA polymerase specialized sigma24 family protein
MLSWYKKSYETPEELYEGLKMEASPAIQKLIHKVTPYIDGLGRKHGLSAEEIEDLIYISVMKHVKCLRAGTYEFDGGCPTRFTFGIAERRVKDYWNKKPTVELVFAQNKATPSIEAKDLLEHGFQHLSNNDEQLLRQTYEEGYKDKEIIQNFETPYENAPALRTARKRARDRFKAFVQPLWGLFWIAIHLTNY